VDFTGGFSGHSYDQEQDFDGNKAGFSNGGDNTAHHGRGKSTAKATGAKRVSKARACKAKVEMARAETARARVVEKAVVAELGKRSTAAPLAEKTKVASPHTTQAARVEKVGGMEGEPVLRARRKTQNLDKRWHDGQVKAHQASVSTGISQDHADDEDQGEIGESAF
jgi:hypothetical protein